MTECSACGTELALHEMRCPTCGKVTAQYQRQRRCMHCGTPAAGQAKTCMMCHKPVDSLPLNKSIFSGSWLGIALGALIVIGIVVGLNRYQEENALQVAAARAVPDTPTVTPTATATPTVTTTPEPPTPTPTVTPTPTATPRIHVVVSGDSLLFISQRYGAPLNVLMDFNKIDRSHILNVGEEILIPPAITDSGVNSGSSLPPQMVYVIKSGDTLSDIAYEHGTTTETIMQANPGVDLDLIFPGQEIIVPLSTPTATFTPTALPTETSTPQPDYPAPNLLAPAGGISLNQQTILLNWVSTRLLADDEFYVVELFWPNGETTEHWLQTTALRLHKDNRPANGRINWTVTIKRKAEDSEAGATGTRLSPPGRPRMFEWQ